MGSPSDRFRTRSERLARRAALQHLMRQVNGSNGPSFSEAAASKGHDAAIDLMATTGPNLLNVSDLKTLSICVSYLVG